MHEKVPASRQESCNAYGKKKIDIAHNTKSNCEVIITEVKNLQRCLNKFHNGHIGSITLVISQ